MSAPKVYTINQESRHVLINNVPRINIEKELILKLEEYGEVERYEKLKDHPNTEEFCDSYLISYREIYSARISKRKLKEKSFFGTMLNMKYAPDEESVEDLREKLRERKDNVCNRLQVLSDQRQKRKTKTIDSKTSNSGLKRHNEGLDERSKRSKRS